MAVMSSSCVRVTFNEYVASLVFQCESDDSCSELVVQALCKAIEGMKLHSSRIALVLIWALNNNDEVLPRGETHGTAVEALSNAVKSLSKPVSGFGDGSLCSIASILMAACNSVICTQRTRFNVSTEMLPPCIRVDSFDKLNSVSYGLRQKAKECSSVDMSSISSSDSTNWPALLAVLSESTEGLSVTENVDMRSSKFSTQRCSQTVVDNRDGGFLEVPPSPGSLPMPLWKHKNKNDPHSCVQALQKQLRKRTDLITPFDSHQGPITSLMLRHIPCRMPQAQLFQDVVDMGFAGTFNFLYLPREKRTRSARSSNLGYGFINFIAEEDAQRFTHMCNNVTLGKTSSKKIAVVQPAHLQGLEANITHFVSRASKPHTHAPLVLSADRTTWTSLVPSGQQDLKHAEAHELGEPSDDGAHTESLSCSSNADVEDDHAPEFRDTVLADSKVYRL